MKLSPRGLLAISFSITIALGLNQSAAASNATVVLDWSKLQISVAGVDGAMPNMTFLGKSTALSSTASIPQQLNESNSMSTYDWTSSVDTNALTNGTYATTLASSEDFSGSVYAIGTSGESLWEPVQAAASGSRTAYFSFDGPGILTATVPYTINITGGEAFDLSNAASASVSGNASFDGYGEGGSFNSYSNASYSLDSIFGVSSQSQSGNLIFGIFAGGAGTGTLGFNFNISALAPISPVPEPESYAMLLAGLGLMSAIIRRRVVHKI